MTDEPLGAEPDDRPRWRAVVRAELGSLAELAALVGLAVVQPVLGPFGESPETFVSVGAAPGDIVRFGLFVTLVPIAVIGLVASATRVFGARVRDTFQTALVAALAGVGAVTLARHLGAGSVTRTVVALVAALGAALVHRGWAPGRLFLRYASPTPLLVLGSFLLASPVAPLVRPAEVRVTTDTAGDHPPVVFIVLDELPTRSFVTPGGGAVDAELFPNLARLAGQSTWYRNNTTVGSRTAVALPAIVTGRLPSEGAEEPPTLASYPDNVITLLARTHQVHAVQWSTGFCPASLCPRAPVELDARARSLLNQPLRARANPVGSLLREARSLWWGQAWPTAKPPRANYTVAGAVEADEIARPALDFLSGLAEPRGTRPVFDYVHVPLPHQPWRLLPSGDTYVGAHPAVGAEFTGWADTEQGEQFALAARSRQLLQLQWTDRWLGAVFDRLEQLGRWDDALVVVTADHGVSFSRGMLMRELTPGNQTEISWTPLFVKLPGQRAGAVNDDNVLSADILPTIADVAGVEVDWKVDGRSLLGPPRTDPDKPTEARLADQFARRIGPNRVELDQDGLAAVKAAGLPPDGPAELRPWRHGRHGDLLGRRVRDLGVCSGGPGVTATYAPPPDWTAFTSGTLAKDKPLPIWHEGTVEGTESRDIAAAVNGVIADWIPSRDTTDGNQFGLLLATPLLHDVSGPPTLYEVVDGACRLRPLDVS